MRGLPIIMFGMFTGRPLWTRGTSEYASKIIESIEDTRREMINNEVSRSVFWTHGSSKSRGTSVSLRNLKKMNMASMELDEVNKGSFLVCKNVLKPVMMMSVMTVIEDMHGWKERLALYNFAPQQKAHAADASSILPVETFLAIKEPYLKISRDGLPMIRVDDANDIIFLSPQDPLVAGFGEVVEVLDKDYDAQVIVEDIGSPGAADNNDDRDNYESAVEDAAVWTVANPDDSEQDTQDHFFLQVELPLLMPLMGLSSPSKAVLQLLKDEMINLAQAVRYLRIIDHWAEKETIKAFRFESQPTFQYKKQMRKKKGKKPNGF